MPREDNLRSAPIAAHLPGRAHHRFGYLLAAQLCLVLVYPFLASDSPRPGVFGVLVAAVLGTGLWVVAGERRLTTVGTALGVLAAGGSLASSFFSWQQGFTPSLILWILFLVLVTWVVLRSILSSPSITTDTLYGAVSAYLLLGLSWGAAYGLLEHLAPGSLRSTAQPGRPLAWPDYSFFSLVTLTTVGYGDIIPVSGNAKTLAALEAVAGVMYPTLFLGRLIGLHGRERGMRSHQETRDAS